MNVTKARINMKTKLIYSPYEWSSNEGSRVGNQNFSEYCFSRLQFAVACKLEVRTESILSTEVALNIKQKDLYTYFSLDNGASDTNTKEVDD